MSVIVTTASSIKALVITRSLGKKGIKVTTGDKQKHALASLSRYSRNSFQYSSPQQAPLDFISQLKQFVIKNEHDVLIPTHSEDTYLLAKHRDELERFIKIPLHDYDSISKANDKGYLMHIAKDLGLPIPKTVIIRDINELDHAADKMHFPMVIKLRTSSSSIGLSYAQNMEELITKYKASISRFNLTSENYPLIQEYISGDGYGVSLLLNHGELRAKFTHKRLREYPRSGGPSSCRISVENLEMEDIAIRLLKYFNWHGVAMVEFKLDKRTEKPVLIEINPRFWGSVNQAICAGVDFPYLLYKMALDGDVQPVLDYKLGIKTRVAFIDYVTLMLGLMRRDYALGTIGDFFRFYPDDIFSVDDSIPTFGFLCSEFRRRLSIGV